MGSGGWLSVGPLAADAVAGHLARMGVSGPLAAADFGNLDTRGWACVKPDGADPAAVIRAFADRPTGFLFAYGPCGRGKSHCEIGLLRRWWRVGWSCALLSMADLRARMESDVSAGESYHATLLLLDDLGAEGSDGSGYRADDWRRAFGGLLDLRWRAGIPTVVMSNLTLEDIAAIDGRWASRLASGIVIHCGGHDRRLIG